MCDDLGCFQVAEGPYVPPPPPIAPVDTHYELAGAAVSPTEVKICTDTAGCFIAPAEAVDVDKVSLVCDDKECVLVPDA